MFKRYLPNATYTFISKSKIENENKFKQDLKKIKYIIQIF